MRVIDVAAVAPQHWRNGGGLTRELLAWPDGDWALRVSVADIARDGPFSPFDGVERWFAVLAGAGVRLQWPGRTVALVTASLPLAFDGAVPPDAVLIDGTTRDLNLMLRRDRAGGALLRATAGRDWVSAAPWRGVLTLGAALLLADGATARALPPWTLAFDAAAAGQRWQLDAESATIAYWIEATPR